MKNNLFRLIIGMFLFQQYLFFFMRENIPELSFLYGVPVTRQVNFHTLLFGYWFLPIFFIIHYFSGYFSGNSSYKMIIIVRSGRNKFFFKKLISMFWELLLFETIQVFINIMINLLLHKKNVFYQWKMVPTLFFMVNYFIVILIIILLQNLLELFFQTININVIINIFIIISVFIYNFNGTLRNGIFKFVNISMCARINKLEPGEYLCLIVIIFVIIGIMFWKWERKDLLGGRDYD